jgi:protein-S-isoprenylcysteine O-methyltransferase Ste14
MTPRRRSYRGWTLLEIVGAGVAILGTLPFAFLLSGLVTGRGSAVASSLGSWEGAVAFGLIAIVGWLILVWARRLAKRPAAVSPGELTPKHTSR